MSLSFFAPNRTVLLATDDGLIIYSASSTKVRLVDQMAWSTEGFVPTLAGILKKTCKGRPVLILNDMTDQHFKGGQRLPKVSVMDKAVVLKRKLQVAFPNYTIRGALPLPQNDAGKKGVKPGGGVKGAYLFAAVPMSDPLTKTFDAVKQSLVSIVGLYLLPIESAGLVEKLSKKIADSTKNKEPSKWAIFIGQHKSGSLRQVIVRNGVLAMTRMTPLQEVQNDMDAWSREVSQELSATISYLSRFGYSSDDKTDVMVVCSQEAGEKLEALIEIPCRFTTFSSGEAGSLMGVPLGKQDDPYHADILHVAWAARKRSFALPMRSPDLEKVQKPRQVVAAAIVISFLGMGYLGYVFFHEYSKLAEINENIRREEQKLARAESDYQREEAKLRELGVEVDLVQGSINAFRDVEKNRLETLSFLEKIDEGLGQNLRIDNISFSYNLVPDPNERVRRGREPSKFIPSLDGTISLTFPATIEPEEGVLEVNNLRRRLDSALPDYDVFIERNVAGLEYRDSFTGTTASSANEVSSEEYEAELRITSKVANEDD